MSPSQQFDAAPVETVISQSEDLYRRLLGREMDSQSRCDELSGLLALVNLAGTEEPVRVPVAKQARASAASSTRTMSMATPSTRAGTVRQYQLCA